MNIIKKGLVAGSLTLGFMLVADMAMAGGLGMIGAHGFIVDGGAFLGEAWNVPQLDWFNLWENGDVSFLDTQTDPCLAAGGHYHGSTCHVGTDNFAANHALNNGPLTFIK